MLLLRRERLPGIPKLHPMMRQVALHVHYPENEAGGRFSRRLGQTTF